MKHTNMLVHRAILELQKSKIYAYYPVIIFRDNYRYRDNFVVHYQHYRDIGFSIIAQA